MKAALCHVLIVNPNLKTMLNSQNIQIEYILVWVCQKGTGANGKQNDLTITFIFIYEFNSIVMLVFLIFGNRFLIICRPYIYFIYRYILLKIKKRFYEYSILSSLKVDLTASFPFFSSLLLVSQVLYACSPVCGD